MITNIILIVLVIAGLAVLGWVVWRRLPQLRIVDPSTDPEEKTKKLKHRILRKRVERAGGKQFQALQQSVLQPFGKGLQNLFRRIAGKLTAVERRYQEKKKSGGEEVYNKAKLNELVEEGGKFLDAEKWERAEKRFIEVIGADPKNVDAYEQLGRLYLQKKELPLAKETFEFLKKLSPKDPSVIASLGEVEHRLGNESEAYTYFKKAVEISPKNPKYLDFLITSALENKELHQAQSTLDRLREVNPKNKKIELFEERLNELRNELRKTSKTPDQKTTKEK